MEMTLDEVIREMNELEQHMQKFEWKYSIKSAEFYKLVMAGVIEESLELHEWLGLYKLWLNRWEHYIELLSSPSPLLKITKPIKSNLLKSELHRHRRARRKSLSGVDGQSQQRWHGHGLFVAIYHRNHRGE